MEKAKYIARDAKKFETFKTYGKKNSKNLVLFWGSTKGAIIDAIKDIDTKALQILYLEPFPEEMKLELYKAKNIMIVENNATAQLSQLVASKTCIRIDDKNKILRYDGRPFLSDELQKEIRKRLIK
jgi:2-oxoglutarate/2-oxoacid ferredoxin oxidoreductase subunit alpha